MFLKCKHDRRIEFCCVCLVQRVPANQSQTECMMKTPSFSNEIWGSFSDERKKSASAEHPDFWIHDQAPASSFFNFKYHDSLHDTPIPAAKYAVSNCDLCLIVLTLFLSVLIYVLNTHQ